MKQCAWTLVGLLACTAEPDELELPAWQDDSGVITLPEESTSCGTGGDRWHHEPEDAHALVRVTGAEGQPLFAANVRLEEAQASTNEMGLADVVRPMYFPWSKSIRISAPGHADTLTTAWLFPGGTSQLTVPLLPTQDFVVSTDAASEVVMGAIKVEIPEGAIVAPEGEVTPNAAFTSVAYADAPEVANSMPDLYTEDWSLLIADAALHLQIRELSQQLDPTTFELAEPVTASVRDTILQDGTHLLWYHDPEGPWWRSVGDVTVTGGTLIAELAAPGWYAIGRKESHEELGCVTGILADKNGVGLGGIRVGLLFPDGLSSSAWFTYPDGRFCVTAVAQGSHLLMASAEMEEGWIATERSILVDQDVPGSCREQTCQDVGTLTMEPARADEVRTLPR